MKPHLQNMHIMVERNLARFKFKMSFGRILNILTGRKESYKINATGGDDKAIFALR